MNPAIILCTGWEYNHCLSSGSFLFTIPHPQLVDNITSASKQSDLLEFVLQLALILGISIYQNRFSSRGIHTLKLLMDPQTNACKQSLEIQTSIIDQEA